MPLSDSLLLAYIDLGTGSYVFQLLVGAFLGSLFAIKTFWRGIKARILGRDKPEEPQQSREADIEH